MTTRPSDLIQAASISLLLIFAPGIAASQDQKDAASEQPPSAAEQPQSQAGQKTGPADTIAQPQPTAPAPETPAETAGNEEQTLPVKEELSEHLIKPGDTLWDIANRYLRDPFLWPFIWKANPSISNPDMIYAGNKLAIPSLAPIERAMQSPAAEPKKQHVEKQVPAKETAPKPEPQKPAVAAVEEEQKPVEGLAAARVLRPKPVAPEEPEAAPAGSRLILPEEQQQPIIDKYSMLRAGFVDSIETDDEVVGGQEKYKTTFGFGDVVFVKLKDKQRINVGDKYLIYAALGSVKHPETGRRYGHLIRGLGILQITVNDPSVDVLTAKITLSFDGIKKESLLVPYQEPVLVYPQAERKTKDITGYILEVTEKQTITGQMDIVYLDKGNSDGIDPGDRFLVYTEPGKQGFPKKQIGEVQVFLVKEHSSTAVVRKSSDTLERGNAIVYTK